IGTVDDDESDDETIIDEPIVGLDESFDEQNLKREFDDWKPEDMEFSGTTSEEGFHFPRDDIEDLNIETMTPVSVVELLFDASIFAYLQQQMSAYALQQNRTDPEFTIDEIKSAFGILIVSGLVPVPTRRHSWSSEECYYNQHV